MYPEINMKATGKYLREIMDWRGVTVKEVQKYLNLSSIQSIYHWLNGSSMPTIDHLYALSDLFQMPVDAMMVGNRPNHKSAGGRLFYTRLNAYCRVLGKTA